MIGLNRIYNEDCLEGMKRIHDGSVDCVLTDPPYLYLKNQKLDIPFDEDAVFAEFKRILKPTGFVVLFGRGTSFYRWNYKLSELGFKFKEEIIWDKINTTSPLLPLSRKHETISVFCKSSKATLNRVKIDYSEMRAQDNVALVNDAKRVVSYIRNNDIGLLEDVIKSGKLSFSGKRTHKSHVSAQKGFGSVNPAASCVQSIRKGCNERSIISLLRDHYSAIHPTQKPVRLLERLLALTTKPGDLVVDPFSGSGATTVACINIWRASIGFEIDKEYFDLSQQRIEKQLNISNHDNTRKAI